ncbi:hypothetical protein MMC10_003229 [Thelotrema lepadinum]|nr:hypothetical protein [Thelotrema lepadinum]
MGVIDKSPFVLATAFSLAITFDLLSALTKKALSPPTTTPATTTKTDTPNTPPKKLSPLKRMYQDIDFLRTQPLIADALVDLASSPELRDLFLISCTAREAASYTIKPDGLRLVHPPGGRRPYSQLTWSERYDCLTESLEQDISLYPEDMRPGLILMYLAGIRVEYGRDGTRFG